VRRYDEFDFAFVDHGYQHFKVFGPATPHDNRLLIRFKFFGNWNVPSFANDRVHPVKTRVACN
jgi:hypothetical protein